ncbi:MAG TPA: hypothetical protein VN706_14640 [Gemmatimonadaceae bacterium]|nr:hypothetical protein [Gemmatimonadaceae bacterium]
MVNRRRSMRDNVARRCPLATVDRDQSTTTRQPPISCCVTDGPGRLTRMRADTRPSLEVSVKS